MASYVFNAERMIDLPDGRRIAESPCECAWFDKVAGVANAGKKTPLTYAFSLLKLKLAGSIPRKRSSMWKGSYVEVERSALYAVSNNAIFDEKEGPDGDSVKYAVAFYEWPIPEPPAVVPPNGTVTWCRAYVPECIYDGNSPPSRCLLTSDIDGGRYMQVLMNLTRNDKSTYSMSWSILDAVLDRMMSADREVCDIRENRSDVGFTTCSKWTRVVTRKLLALHTPALPATLVPVTCGEAYAIINAGSPELRSLCTSLLSQSAEDGTPDQLVLNKVIESVVLTAVMHHFPKARDRPRLLKACEGIMAALRKLMLVSGKACTCGKCVFESFSVYAFGFALVAGLHPPGDLRDVPSKPTYDNAAKVWSARLWDDAYATLRWSVLMGSASIEDVKSVFEMCIDRVRRAIKAIDETKECGNGNVNKASDFMCTLTRVLVVAIHDALTLYGRVFPRFMSTTISGEAASTGAAASAARPRSGSVPDADASAHAADREGIDAADPASATGSATAAECTTAPAADAVTGAATAAAPPSSSGGDVVNTVLDEMFAHLDKMDKFVTDASMELKHADEIAAEEARLTASLQALQVQNNELLAEERAVVSSLEQRTLQLEGRQAMLDSEMHQFRSIETVKRDIAKAMKEHEAVEARLQAANVDVERLTNEMPAAKDKAAEARAALAAQEGKIAAAAARCAELQKQAARASEAVSTNASLQRDVETARRALAALQKRCAAAETRVAKQHERLPALRTKLTEAHERGARSREAVVNLNARIAASSAEYDTLRDQIDAHRLQERVLEQQCAKLAAVVAEKDTRAKAAVTSAAKPGSRLQALEQSVKQLGDVLVQLTQARDAALREVTSLVQAWNKSRPRTTTEEILAGVELRRLREQHARDVVARNTVILSHQRTLAELYAQLTAAQGKGINLTSGLMPVLAPGMSSTPVMLPAATTAGSTVGDHTAAAFAAFQSGATHMQPPLPPGMPPGMNGLVAGLLPLPGGSLLEPLPSLNPDAPMFTPAYGSTSHGMLTPMFAKFGGVAASMPLSMAPPHVSTVVSTHAATSAPPGLKDAALPPQSFPGYMNGASSVGTSGGVPALGMLTSSAAFTSSPGSSSWLIPAAPLASGTNVAAAASPPTAQLTSGTSEGGAGEAPTWLQQSISELLM